MSGAVGVAERRARRRGALILLALALAAYAPSLGGEFLSDDVRFVVENPAVHELTPASVVRYFVDPHSQASFGALGIYRPLRTLDFAIDWAISGGDPFFFRVRNVLWLALGAILAWALFRRLDGEERAALASAPFLGAALFVLHPVHVESVAFVSSRGDLLCLVLFLAALVLHLDGRSAAAALALAGALLAKETAAVFPAVAFLADSFSRRPKPRPLMAYGTYALLAVAFAVVWVLVTGRPNPEGLAQRPGWPGGSWPLTVVLLGKGLLHYARELVLPVAIDFDWYVPSRGLAAPANLLIAAAGFGVFAAALLAGRRARFASLWFLALLLPVSGLLVPLAIPTAERWLLLPAVGFAFAVAPALARTRLRHAVFACFLLLTMAEAREWRSFDELTRAGLPRTPTPLTLGHRAWRQVEAMERTRSAADAEAVLATIDAAFRLYAEDIEGRVPAGYAASLLGYRANALLTLDRPEEALRAAREAVARDPTAWSAHDTARAAFFRMGLPEEALAEAEAAFRILDAPVTRRRLAESLFHVGRERERTGDFAAARALYARSWSLLPDPEANAPARAALDRLR